MGTFAMDVLIETLRVLREVRDWARSRRSKSPSAEATRAAIEDAMQVVRAQVGPESSAEEAPERASPETSVEEESSDLPDIDLDRLDPHAVSAVRRLRKNGFKAYLVGGCVRDLLFETQPKDFDVSTDAEPEEIKALFRNSRIIGRRFRLVHLYFRGGKIIEVATFRANANSEDEEDLLIRRDNVFGTEEEDAQRRDFTINGLFYDVGRGRIIDHVGGLPDVKARYLRMIGDPDIRLREDPVRILRAIRFFAKNGLEVDPPLLESIREHRGDLSRCAPPRLLEEVLKLFRAGFAARSVEVMEEWDVLRVLLPELADFVDGKLFDGNPADARERLYASLHSLDALVEERPVADVVVFAALILPPLYALMDKADEEKVDRLEVQAAFLDAFGKHITLTRKNQERLRQILQAQKAFGRAGAAGSTSKRRRRGPQSLILRPYFDDALDLYEIRCRALGLPLDEVQVWRQRAMERGPLPEEDAPPKRRRRRKRRTV